MVRHVPDAQGCRERCAVYPQRPAPSAAGVDPKAAGEAVTGRYFVVVDRDDGIVTFTSRADAAEYAGTWDRDCPDAAPHRIVECVAMPRVTIVRLARGRHSVRVNDVEVMATAIEPRAKRAASDLRRALRKGGW